uniref:Uncharacterized protein n=1 Tax=Caenorhabditis japonica TaxID=281687 RepID=A0A8R1HJY9_CAEJA
LLEPIEETIAEPIVKPEKPELTKEEIDHITWIQQIAEQTSFEKVGPPSRPPVPARLPTVDEPVAIQKQLTEHDEDRSSATSGADFETSFDHDGLYEKTSPLLEPVEETIAKPIVKPEKPELTQEEIDHIAWIQQIAEQTSFEKVGPPSRPPVPARLPTVDEPVAIQKQLTEHDEDRSSATSGADFETSFDHDGSYEKTSPLLEPVEETIAKPIVKPEKPELTQEEIDHIAWIHRLPNKHPLKIDEPVAIQKQLTEHDEDRSSATSGADFETSFDHDGLYERTSPLLEPVEETITEPIVKPEKPELTQEEIDHITWTQQIAEQSSFEAAEPPTRPPVPARLPTVDEPVAIQKQFTEHDKDRSSATSGADFETSFDHDGLYERTSPLLEPVEETIAEPIVKPEKPELTQGEIDHIAWIQQIAEQSSFETTGPPSRPPVPARLPTVDKPVTIQKQLTEHDEDKSSATSGADFETSFDHDGLYERTSPLLEPVEETIAEPIVKPEKPELTQEEIEHIVWIQQIAEQSSFETTGPPSRPPVPARLPTVDEPVAIQKQLTEHDEDKSSATSGADFETSFDHDGLYERTSPLLEPVEETIAEPIVKPEKPELTQEEIDHIAWIQQIAEQSSFETTGPPSRPPVPARLPTVDEPVANQKQFTEHDEDRSSATSGADFETSFDHDGLYERTSPLLEPVEETIAEPIAEATVKPEKPELTQEEIDHIAWIQQIAEQSSFETTGPPSRPPVPARLPTVDEPVANQKQFTEHDEDRSSATSGADFEKSFDYDGLYESTSPLLEPVEETIAESIAEATVKPEKPELTQEEIDHIAWIQQIAEQSSFETTGPPSRPPVPARLPTVDEPVANQKQFTEHDEDRSSATSGADFETSFDHDGLYESTSPLLEPVEETIPEPIVKPEKPELTQEEIDHITWTQQIAEQSSFEAAEPPTRPPVPARLPTVDEPVAIQKQLTEHDEDKSSATSGADFETSFDHDGLYERTSPLLEPVEETIPEPIVKPEKPELTQEEIDHITWTQQIAEQSSFEAAEPPTRPPVPARLPTVDEPVAIQKQLTEHDEDRSSATSGADFETSFDHDGLYERTSPLLEPVEETITEPIVKPEKPELTQEEIDHITWTQQIAEQSSFEAAEPPTRPPVPARLPTVDEPVAIQKQLTEHDEDRSSATSGADFETSFDHDGLYERTSPLLEPVEETIAEPIAEATVKPEKPELTQEELDHIAWIQQMAEQASFETAEPPSRPPVPARLPTVDEPVAIEKQLTEHDEDRSSETSGADFEKSFDHDGLYERTSPLFEPVGEANAEFTEEAKEPELTQEEIDHIAWIQKMADQSSFEAVSAPTRPPVPVRLPTVDEPVVIQKQLTEHDEDRSSATSGADFERSFDQDGAYERTTLLFEPVEKANAEFTEKAKEPELTQEEIDHIAWIQKMAEQSSFEAVSAPTRPPIPVRFPNVDEPVVIQKQLTEHDEDRSSATSGADFERSFDQDVGYERTTPLLEPVEEANAEFTEKAKEPELTQEEIDHIAWIQKMAEQSSFEAVSAPTRPPIPVRLPTVDEPVVIQKQLTEHDEDRSSATSGADFERSFDQDGAYERTTPLLEPVEEANAEFTEKAKEPELTQEEIDHIAWIQKMAEQSSFEAVSAPTRPPVPVRIPTVDEPVVIQKQFTENDEDRSSATSGADFERSFDQDGAYEKTTPLLEPVDEENAEFTEKAKEPELTQEEIDHIAWIQKMAEQSSFEAVSAPTRPPVPVRLPTVDEPVVFQKQLTEHDEDRSIATIISGSVIPSIDIGTYDKFPVKESIADETSAFIATSVDQLTNENWAVFDEIPAIACCDWPLPVAVSKISVGNAEAFGKSQSLILSERELVHIGGIEFEAEQSAYQELDEICSNSRRYSRELPLTDDVIAEEDESELLAEDSVLQYNVSLWKEPEQTAREWNSIPTVSVERTYENTLRFDDEEKYIGKTNKSCKKELRQEDDMEGVTVFSSENPQCSDQEHFGSITPQCSFDSSLPPFHQYAACPSITPSEGEDGGSSETGPLNQDDISQNAEHGSYVKEFPEKEVVPIVEICIDEATSESQQFDEMSQETSIADQDVSLADAEFTQDEQSTLQSKSVADPELTQDELEHIAKIQEEMSQFDNAPVVFRKSFPDEISEDKSENETNGNFVKNSEIREKLTQAENDYIPVVHKMADQSISDETLTQEELDHIARIAQMALNDLTMTSKSFEPELSQKDNAHICPIAGKPAEEFTSSVKILNIKKEEPELTQEELDHIAQVQKMAEQLSSSEEPKVTSKQILHKNIQLETSSVMTQEELDHIQAIQKMAEQHSFEMEPIIRVVEDLVETPILTTTQLSEDRSDATSGADEHVSLDIPSPISEFAHRSEIASRIGPLIDTKEPELTKEELDHIAMIQKMAEQSYFENGTPSPLTLTRTSHIFSEKENVFNEKSNVTSDALTEQSLDQTASIDFPRKKEAELVREEVEYDHDTIIQKINGQSFFIRSTPLTFVHAPSPQISLEDEFVENTEDDLSTVTSGADPERSFDLTASIELPEKKEQELTQKELDHIALVQRMAAQSSFEAHLEPNRVVVQLSEENSSSTSGAEIPSSFDASSPILDHITSVQGAHAIRDPNPQHIVEHVSEENSISSATSGADLERSFDGVSPLPQYDNQEMTMDHVDYVLMVTHMAMPENVALPLMETSTMREVITDQLSIHSGATSGAVLEVSGESEKISKKMSEGLTKEELNHIAEVLRKAEASSAASGVFERDSNLPPLRRTSITYTSHFSPSVIKDIRSSNSFTSSSEVEVPKARLVRETSVQVVYTDHILRDLQSINAEQSEKDRTQSSESHEEEDCKDIEKTSNDVYSVSSVLAEDDQLITDVYDFNLKASLLVQHYVMQQSTFQEASGLHISPIRRTMSAACTAEKHSDDAEKQREREVKASQSHDQIKKRGDGEPNDYELLEQHSFRHAQPLLCNVDFLWRLNFAANRMTEEIAEEAGRELRAHYRNVANPRARYFSDAYDIGSEEEEETEETAQRSPLGFSVEPMRHDEPSYGLFSFFTSSKKSVSDRPKSALATFTNLSQSVSPSLLRKESEDRGDILNLLRRSSGADSRASNDSAASRLPDNALVGLSDTERQHIISVISRSNRNSSPMTSRRCSSALQMLPEVDNISEAEKEHIQNILEKAESRTPFMIKLPMKKQISSRTESTNSRVSSEGIDEEIEIEEIKKKGEPFVEAPSRAVTPRSNLRVIPPPIAISHPTPPHSAKTDTGSKHSSGSSAHSHFGFNTPSISGFKMFFDKAKTATETLVKEIKDEVQQIDVLEKPSEHVVQNPDITEELTAQELEHIRKVNEIAEFDEPVQDSPPVQERRKSSVVSGLKSIFGVSKHEELSKDEQEHIRRMSLIADKLNEEIEVMDEKPQPNSGFGLKSFFGKATQSVMQATDNVIKNVISTEVSQPEQSLEGLTQQELDQIANAAESAQEKTRHVEVSQEEMDHIARVAAMAAVDFDTVNVPTRGVPVAESELTEEEKAHIARIAAMAAEDFGSPNSFAEPAKSILSVFSVDPELTEEEKAHIARIAAMAAEDFEAPMSFVKPAEPVKIRSAVEPKLTEEENNHIARIAAMAAEDFGTSMPIAKPIETVKSTPTVASVEPELTEDEKAHIARIAAMAAEDFNNSMPMPSKITQVTPSVAPRFTEPELTQEEIDHIARIAEMAANDNVLPVPQPISAVPRPSVVLAEPELTEEEMAHIARIAAMADEDFITTTPFAQSIRPQEDPDNIAKTSEMAKMNFIPSADTELTKEELEHIAKIAAMAAEENENQLPATRLITPAYPEPELTQEELDHIAKITQMAAAQELELTRIETSLTESDATSGADSADDNDLFDDQEDEEEYKEREEDDVSSQVGLTSGAASPDRVTSSALDTTDEMPIIAPYKVVSSSSPTAISFAGEEDEDQISMASTKTSRKSSEYDIRSISEIRKESDSDVGKWYEEQLSFMRQSIHDEEDDAGHEIQIDVEEFPSEYVEDQLQFVEGNYAITAPAPPSLSTTGRSIEYFGEEGEEEKNENVVLSGSGGVEETKKSSSRGREAEEKEEKRMETQRSDDVRTRQAPIDSLPGSRMLKRPNFGFLSNFANDAVNKAKEAGSQIQAAVPIKPSTSATNIFNNNVFSSSKSTSSLDTRPLGVSTSKSPTIPTSSDIPMDGLSEEERRQIMSVMAAADFDDAVNNIQPSTSSNIPAGMEDLSEEERQKIMAVMASAEMDMEQSLPPARSPSIMSTSSTRPGVSLMSEVPPGLEDLSEEERQKILSVMADAEMQDVRPPIMAASEPPPMHLSSMIPPGLEGLTEEERQKIMMVMADAEMDTTQSLTASRLPSRSPSVARVMSSTSSLSPMQQMSMTPLGMEGLSEEERQKIMSVMANAEFEEAQSRVPSTQPSRSPSFARGPSPSVQSMPIIPPGLEDLSEEERQKIMMVMANAEVEESRSQLPSRQPSRSPSIVTTPSHAPTAMPVISPWKEDAQGVEKRKMSSEAEIQSLMPRRSPSSYSMPPSQIVPPGLELLSAEEREKIMSVMAEAEFDSAQVPSRSPSTYGMPLAHQLDQQPSIIPPGLEELSDAERQKIMAVMEEAEFDSAQLPNRSSSVHQMVPTPAMPAVPPGLEELSEQERKKIMAVMANAELEYSQPSSQFAEQEESLPRGHTGFTPAGIVNEDELFETERKIREDQERRHQTPLESPTRESGYATSTSYERELAMGDSEEQMDGLLEDIIRIREGATSRRDSRDEIEHRREQQDEEMHSPEEIQTEEIEQAKPTNDFDFTYSDSRFADIVKMQEEEEAAAILQKKEEEKPRMWETVFDGDESELPQKGFLFNEPAKKTSDFDFPKETDEVFETPTEIQRIKVTQNHDIEIDEAYDNVTATKQEVKEPTYMPRPIQRAPSKPPPMIKVTGDEETKSDSDEESCSEDDDEYPDKVVAAPTAPTPTYEEVENERIKHEEMGKEVLQQIQQMAFGEVANDEFDVQWAKSTSTKKQPDVVTAPTRSDPIPIAPSERSRQIEEERAREEAQEEADFYHHGHNPFLEDLDEDEVSINMEDVEYGDVLRFYESSNQNQMASRPVYTIAEDESEDDGTLNNSESRMIAREKRSRNRRTAESLMERIQTMKKVTVKPTPTPTTTPKLTATPAYAIINFTEPQEKTTTKTTRLSNTELYFESTRPIPPREIKEPQKDIPPEISASIDKTMAEVDALLGQVYTNEKAKPNLLCFDQTKFTQQPPTSSASTSTADDMILLMNRNDPSTSPSFLLPLQSSVLGSQLDSVKNENEATSPRGLKRSPGMLLPSPTSSAFPLPLTAAESVGAAIGATTATMFNGVNISDPPPTMDRLTNAYKWLQNIEDDGNVANNEMGRRKLPSIPPNSSAFPPPAAATTNIVTTHTSIPSTSSAFVDDYNVTLPSDPIVPESLLKGGSLTRKYQQQHQQPQAPVYITSSASRPPSATGGNIFTDSRPTSSLSMYQNDVILSRPASAASNYTTASTINPTILVGAAYSSKPTSHLRQTVSVQQPGVSTSSAVPSASIRSSVGTSSATSRVPNTLARVLLKKELKDVLNQRKQRLEATEIEANQRHYKVQKMLVTGLLPEKQDDEIPDVVKCDLPADLVRGVHISMQPPSPANSTLTPRKYHPTPVKRSTVLCQSSPRSASKSIACQADETPTAHHHHRTTVSLRTQLDMERRPHLMTYVGKRSAETQTEMTNFESTIPTVRYGSMPKSSRERSASRRYREQQQQIYNQMPQNHNDLLEITKRYFEDYDRQLREFGERARKHTRNRFEFHDDDDQDNMRKAQVMSELARKKERLCASCEVLSTADPIGSALNPNVPMSSDYSSHVPHYGSLPRIDYPRGTRSDVRDFTFRQQHLPQQPINYAYNYGSLPRNFERYASGLPPIEIENEQSFGAPPRNRSNIGYESTSMFNLSDPAYLGGYEPPIISSQQPRVYDQISGYANDTTNLNLGQSTATNRVRGSDMVSQYASYLNSQFQTGLQQSAQLPQPMQPITRYDAPMSDPYMTGRMRDDNIYDNRNLNMNPYQSTSVNPNQNQYYYHSTLLAPKPAIMTHIAPTYNQLSQQVPQQQPGLSQMPSINLDPLMMSRAPAQVYSRNEMNYGSRPAQSSLFEYGNRRQYAPGSAPPAVVPTYDVPSEVSDWRNPQMSSMMPQQPQQHHTYDARWPKEDALSRMYATASRRRPAGQETTLNSSNKISTGSRHYARRPIRPSSYRTTYTSNSMPDRHVAKRSMESECGKYDVKRILLTRGYKQHNVYNDLGVRVVGGKRQKNGELSAYVSQLHSSVNNQTLGQIKIGDEVVEWNGILLRGKTFEEVERVVNASHGEVEMVIRTERAQPPANTYDSHSLNRNITTGRHLLSDELSPDRVPPVPMHRINGINNNSVLHHHTLSDSSCNGHIQVSLGYDGNARLVAKVIRARGLRSRDQYRSSPNPFVKVYLLPGRKVSHKRRTRFVDSSCAPEWNQVLEYQVAPHTLNTMFLEFTVCDYQRDVDDLPLGSVQIPLADKSAINTGPRWYPLQSTTDQSFNTSQRQQMNGTSRIPSVASASQSQSAANYSEVPQSILYSKGASRHPDKPVRHATFNYNPVSLDIGYPAIN